MFRIINNNCRFYLPTILLICTTMFVTNDLDDFQQKDKQRTQNV